MNLNYSQKTSCFNSPIPHRHTSSPIRLYAYNFAKVIFTGEKGIQKGRKEGIQGTIDVLRKLNYSNEEIKSMIIEQYTLSEDEVAIYLQF